MKTRKLLTDIFIVILMISIVLVLLAYLGVFPGESYEVEGSLARKIILVAVPLALVSVLLVDIVFPVIDNLSKLKEKVFLVKVIVKGILFIAAVVVLVCHVKGMFMNEFLGVGVFCGIYLIQFFIDLDKKGNKELNKQYEDTFDEEEDEDDFIDDDDDDYCAYDDEDDVELDEESIDSDDDIESEEDDDDDTEEMF